MNEISKIGKSAEYEADFHQWTVDQARLLRAGNLDKLDLRHLAEEIEALGRSEKREIESRLEVLLVHLLKLKFQPEKQTRSWLLTLKVQRKDLEDVISENPSLRDYPNSKLSKVYLKALIVAERETGIDLENFPSECPFTITEVLDKNYLPEPVD